MLHVVLSLRFVMLIASAGAGVGALLMFWEGGAEMALAAHHLYQELKNRYFLEVPEVFAPQPLIYKVKREQPASKKQKEVLRELLKYHRINLSAQIDSLSKNEISRLTDQIIAQHGRMQKR